MIQLIITVKTQPGRKDDYIAAFAQLAPAVRKEEGCIEFGLYDDCDDSRFDNERRPDTVIICEKWSSIETLQFHTKHSAPLQRFRQQVKDVKASSTYVLLKPVVSP